MKISKLSNSIRPNCGGVPLDVMLAVYMSWGRTQQALWFQMLICDFRV